MTTTRSIKNIFIVCALAIAMAAGAMRPANAFLDKTRFVTDLGVAYFCFHHWVWKPYQQGAFSEGAPHRTAAVVKAGAALLFAWNRVHAAENIARTSKDPLLQKLNGAVGGLATSFSAIGSKLKSGHFDPNDITSLHDQTGSVASDAAAGGATIKDVPVTVPGT
ncbi:MAG TPA: hypothetical protein VGZ02_06550 [Candidatus Baltobacteraceae bacterium]|jgi:hypothetical protein|nr:hypothetical protein [Candidatus Baltobacteraceae bacterium]